MHLTFNIGNPMNGPLTNGNLAINTPTEARAYHIHTKSNRRDQSQTWPVIVDTPSNVRYILQSVTRSGYTLRS